MMKTKKITRVLAGFAVLLMCGATMTGCDSPEKGDIFYRTNDSSSYIGFEDVYASSGVITFKNVTYMSVGKVSGNGTYNKNGTSVQVTFDKTVKVYGGATIGGKDGTLGASSDGSEIYVSYDAGNLKNKHTYKKSSTKSTTTSTTTKTTTKTSTK